MKIGAIDIGTNSMRLLVAEYSDNKFIEQKKYVNTTRIGRGVNSEGIISEEAICDNIKALQEFKEICIEQNCEKIHCVGTSALRDAKNGSEFVDLAKKYAGIDVDIISGEEESFLGFAGVLEGIEENENILVIDIGGGSTEFIFGNNKNIEFMKSENVGALRMTEKFIKSDKIENSELEDMKKFIKDTIEDTIKYLKHKDIKNIVGIGGTITSVSAMNQELEIYSTEKVHNSVVSKTEIDNLLQKLMNMTLSDKKRLKGLQPKRADIITAGVIILEIIVNELEMNRITVSEYDNLEGLVCKNYKNMS